MVRTELKKIKNERLTFSGVVSRFGTKNNYRGMPSDTICVADIKICDSTEIITDHVWFTIGSTISNVRLQIGDTIKFDARVKSYTKGYVNHREYIDERTTDYRLSHPTKIKILDA